MSAPIGNQYWRLAHDWNKPVKLKPEEILPKIEEYLQWLDDNPLIEEKAFGTGHLAKMSKMRAPTIRGFCSYVNMSSSVWYDYENQDAYSSIMARAKDILFSIKVEGAAAGLLDSNIIARELGLAEKVERTGETKQQIVVSSKEDEKTIEELFNKLDEE